MSEASGEVEARLLAPFLEVPETSGVFSDFDGTLAPIVADPAQACPLEGVASVLADLARKFGRAGVISGRPAAFLRQHLGGGDLFLSGLYGLESVVDGKVEPLPSAAQWVTVVEAAADDAEDVMPDGVTVERKGLSATIHYRNQPSAEPVARRWAAHVADETGLVVHEARMSVELRPPVRRDKGIVLEEAAKGLAAACFIGDDIGDLSAFDALDRLAASGVTTLRVAVNSEEAPAELLERADLVVDDPTGVLAFLRRLL